MKQNVFIQEFDLLSKREVLGLFNVFELIEIVGFKKGNSHPINVFTIAVACDELKQQEPEWLNEKRIKVSGLNDWSFGMRRSVVILSRLRSALDDYLQSGTWKPIDSEISTGSLVPIEKRFVPPNALNSRGGMGEIPLNRVTKNNFFNGSYLLELSDIAKEQLADIYECPVLLQRLSEQVSEILPLRLASLSDRLGSIIIQFPVEAVNTSFSSNGSQYFVEVAWHPKVTPRPLTATLRGKHDKSILSFGQTQLMSGIEKLADDPNYGTIEGHLWDSKHGVLLAAVSDQSFINTIILNSEVIHPEPRIFPSNVQLSKADARVKLSAPSAKSLVGNDPAKSVAEQTTKRILEDELINLVQSRKFVQYAAGSNVDVAERSKALSDLQSLISSYGHAGVWLWDPYLGPQDLLDTLFHNPTVGAPMRALTRLKEQPQPNTNKYLGSISDRCTSYNQELSNLPSNYLGLNLEFRSAHGQNGWDFHDRFMIFPRSSEAGAKAWSLGTSVNSFGKVHHILQQVDNGQLIEDAFERLWKAVGSSTNLIWKYPYDK